MDRLDSEDMENYNLVMRYITPYPDVYGMIGDSGIVSWIVIGDASTIIFDHLCTDSSFIQ